MFSKRQARLAPLAPGASLADKDDTERTVRKVRLERLADGDAVLERELDEALEQWVRELSELLRR